MLRLMVDFNDVQDGIVAGLTESLTGPRAAVVGDRVLLHDDGEHEMWGTVTRTRRGLIDAAVEWTTWRPAHRQHAGSWRNLVPKLTTDVSPTFRPMPAPVLAHALQWSERYGESSNVCAQLALWPTQSQHD